MKSLVYLVLDAVTFSVTRIRRNKASRREGGIHGVMSLGKSRTIPGEACLVVNPFLTR
ncbi:MAG: hypothetical protein KZQ76_04995 [Candidatus Thiodiazotropha sp. (ex Epidulcina cf. delphinae)]|nr:hypothetical protein [Candidatus Thiodiazotropha sp. (ex Epidulcina cf. delphinae)]